MASDYNIIVEVMAQTEQFVKNLRAVESEIQSTADRSVAIVEKASQRVNTITARSTETMIAEQRAISAETNASVQRDLANMGKAIDKQKPAIARKGAEMGTALMRQMGNRIAAGASVGLILGAIDGAMQEAIAKMKGHGEDSGVGFLAGFGEFVTNNFRKLPIFGSLMDTVGGAFGAFGFEAQQAERAKQQERSAQLSGRARKQEMLRLAILEAQTAEYEAGHEATRRAAQEVERMMRDAAAGAKMIADNRRDMVDNVRSAQVRLFRIENEGNDEAIKAMERELELFEQNLDFERRITEARQEGRNLLAEELEQHREALELLTQQAHAAEDRNEKLREAREVGDAYLELEEAIADAQLKASQATSSFSTAGGSFVTKASVGGLNEQKMMNKISQKSQDILLEIEGNTRNIFSGVDLA